MRSLIKRNLQLYFGQPSQIFFSLLGAIISFLLYILFLKKSMLDSWSQIENAKRLLAPWLIGGTMAVSAATTTFEGLNQMIIDRETGKKADLQLTGLSPYSIQLSYIVTAIIIGMTMQLFMLVLMLTYFVLTKEINFQVSWLWQLSLISIFSSVVWTSFNALILTFVKKVNSLGSISTILGTSAGFLAGVYIPIGVMPKFAQSVIKLTPFPYNSALYRQILMNEELNKLFIGLSTETQTHFKSIMGVGIELSKLTTWQQNIMILFAMGVGFTITNLIIIKLRAIK